jgi:hypothetical protein
LPEIKGRFRSARSRNASAKKLRLDQWRQILNPIYEELRSQGKPDLTAIIVYKSGELRGYPPFFSDGAEPQSRPFNPNNKRQLERWTNEVNRVFSTWQKKND